MQENEERYRALVECSPEPIVVYSKSRISYANAAASRLIGAETPEILIGERVLHFIHPGFTEMAKLTHMLLLEGKASEVIEIKLVRLDGKAVDVELRAVPVKFHGTSFILLFFRDITDRKRAEAKLIESETRFQRLLQLSPDPVILHCNGVIQIVNDIGIRFFRANSSQEFIGRSIFEFFSPEDHPKIASRMNQAIHSDGFLGFQSYRMKVLDGTELDVEISSVYVDEQLGSPIFQSVVRDMTERKNTEEYVRTSEKLSIIGKLAAGIAHEIRNPLTSLKGFAQILKAINTKYIDIMLEELERINYIVNEFMTLAKPHSVTYTENELRPLVVSVVRLMQPQALLFNVDLQLEAEANLKKVLCEPNQIKQVIMNIIKNAIESMTTGGVVSISLKQKDEFNALICIEDQGVGIPEDQLAKLGEPFFSTKDDGNGLGITICQQILKAHQGTLTIRSKPNVGTTVEVEIQCDMRDYAP
ncbi:PAS domain S-box protein [Paenibacillus sp. Soil787]|uniref:PAS domain S-box protein n=1 Tax=Paenibacillus sp. Soil787 TaxID=1736411 RepID=UPI0006F7E3BB|nr:PAS domain S-box protein [Paenibacillus sp. Soil787]KRF43679.1 hypothetical protein ASG93_01800 [Paenibacillus sp. Soil787]